MSAKEPPTLECQFSFPLDSFCLNVDFVATQCVTGIFGVSGAGKSTWLDILAGWKRPESGVIRFGDQTWLDSKKKIFLPPEDRSIGYVPQNYQLFPHLPVMKNLRFGESRALKAGHDFKKVLSSVIEILELESLLERQTESLSGGECQRVALGRAICSGPQLLLLDEPLASLDRGLSDKIIPFIQRILETFSIPMILVSHHPVEVLALCDELVILERGKCLTSGDPFQVLTQPAVIKSHTRGTYTNTLKSQLVHHDVHTSHVALTDTDNKPGEEIIVPRNQMPLSSRVTLQIDASDILLSSENVSGISARNRLPGTVSSIQDLDHRKLVSVRLNQSRVLLFCEVTQDALAELDLRENSPVWVIFKSSSATVF